MRRIYGVIGTEVNGGIFNADFTGRSRRDSKGELIHSDVALKYCFRHCWNVEDRDSVLAFTKYYDNGNPMVLEDNFKVKFKKMGKNRKEVIEQLLTYRDVRNFGIAFAIKGINVSLRGAVQIGWGRNINKEAIERPFQVQSPYSSEKGKGQTTLGLQYVVEDALFIAPLTIDIKDEYCEEDYKRFMETSRMAVTRTQSRSKFGCNSAFSLFVELNDTLLPTDFLSDRIQMEENRLIFDFLNLDLKSVNLYINMYKYKVEIKSSNIQIDIENLF